MLIAFYFELNINLEIHTIVASSKIAARILSSLLPAEALFCLPVDDMLALARFFFTCKSKFDPG